MKWSVFCLVNVVFVLFVPIVKKHTSHVSAFKINTIKILSDLVFACWKQSQDLCVPLLFVQYSYIPICNTKHYIYKTKYAQLHHSRIYANAYIGIGSTYRLGQDQCLQYIALWWKNKVSWILFEIISTEDNILQANSLKIFCISIK